MNRLEELTKEIAAACKAYRVETLKMTQDEIAAEIGYTRTNISEFENGRNRNLSIFMYYVSRGLPMETLERILSNG